ncbi:MAG TPA: ABC transporter substrate-binding protein [Stellaceae bacterium]|nr:ABC transporter substrate-binding protein [Stellaceae bacterium]
MPPLTRRTFARYLAVGAASARLTGGGRAFAAAPDKIAVGILPLASHAPTFIAAGKGYFTEQGLDARLVSFEAAEPMAVAIAAHDVDFGVTAITGGLISLADKDAVRVIGGALQETPGVEGQKILASKKAHDAGLTAPAQLKGRSFGITTAGSSFQYMAHKIAQKEGFADADIELRPLQKVPVLIAALKTGQIDAWSIVPNIADTLTRDATAVEIGRIADYIANYQVTTVFTSAANAGGRRELVTRFLAAYSKGVADYNAAFVDKTMGREASAAIVAIIHDYVYSSLPLDKADPMIRAGAMRINPNARLNLGSVKDQLDWFAAEHLVPPGVTLAKLVDSSFVATD